MAFSKIRSAVFPTETSIWTFLAIAICRHELEDGVKVVSLPI